MDQEFTFRSGSLTLRGTLTLPAGPGPHPALVVAHGASTPERSYQLYAHLARNLPLLGLAVLRFDRRGSGTSEGDFASASFDDLAADLLAALAWLEQRPDIDGARLGLWGLSQGGWLAPLAAAARPDLAFVIAVSACGVAPAPQMDYSAAFALREAGFHETAVAEMLALRAQVNAAYRGQTDAASVQQALDTARDRSWFPLAYLPETLPADPECSKWALEMSHDPAPVMQALRAPLLLLYGERDAWVPVAESIRRWRQHGPSDLTVEQIDDANHNMVSIVQAGVFANEGPIVPAYTSALRRWLQQQTLLAA